MRIVASVLAGGYCKRFGFPKFMTLYGNRLLIKIILEEVKAVFDDVIVISGYYHNLLKKNINVPVVFNPEYEKGMSSSIKTAVLYAQNNNFDGICIIPSDMPYINRKLLTIAKEKFLTGKYDAVSFCKEEKPVPPVIFSSFVFEELKKLHGDKGAKEVLQKLKRKYYIKGYEPYLFDVDTVKDYIKTLGF